MDIKGIKIGVALTGSFCTFDKAFKIIEKLVNLGAEVTPIISHSVNQLDTRFHKAADVKSKLKELTNKEIIKDITAAEPVGPKNMFDIIIVMPCTGNTIAKLANAITDTPVLMAVKSQLRNKKPIIIGIATNDGLGNNAKNIGHIMNMENVYFVPFSQDDPKNKEMSLVFLEEKVIDTIKTALKGSQIQPVIS